MTAGGKAMDKLRLLFAVPSLGMGGMERVCINYCNLMSARGHDVTLLNLTSHSDELIAELSDKVRYIPDALSKIPNLKNAGIRNILSGNFRLMSGPAWMKYRSAEHIHKKLIHEEYDAEIAFYGGNLIRIIAASPDKSSYKLGWVHAQSVDKHIRFFTSYKKARETYNKIEGIICVSETVTESVKRVFGRENNVFTLYNPCDTAKIRESAKEKSGVPDKKRFTFITASRMDIQHKGIDRMLDAASRLINDGYDFDIWLVGDGKDEDAVRDMIAERGLENVSMFGRQENPFKFIDSADMYLCTSRYEGFSMVMAESLILAKPVLTTDISGAREMLGDSEYGLIVPSSTEGIYDGMKRILDDTALYEHYTAKAWERCDFLDSGRLADEFESLLYRGCKKCRQHMK